MSGRLLLLAALVLVAGFAPAPFPRTRQDDPQKDLRRMQGTWVVVKYEHNGQDNLSSYGDEIRFTFQGKRMTWIVGDQIHTRWDVELSPGSVPRAMTKTRDDKGFEIRGIYRFEGDRLIVCEAQGRERPTEFASKGNSWLIEMKRR